jgi:glycerol uptake facilitator-like aquaporin
MTGGTIKGNVESGLFVAILLLGGISGGHFNPAVTIAFIIQQGVTVVEGILYIISQLIGGTMGNFFQIFSNFPFFLIF